MGIEKTQSHRWQKIAEIPEEKFEEHIYRPDPYLALLVRFEGDKNAGL
jgi:hypothetical protein